MHRPQVLSLRHLRRHRRGGPDGRRRGRLPDPRARAEARAEERRRAQGDRDGGLPDLAVRACATSRTRSLAFPKLNFQIIHGGFAYLEETALQLSYYRNASVVLEGASAYIVNSPLRFAEILARFLMTGAADRIIWGTGCTALHPRPLLEAFWDFQLPEAMIEGYGFPPLTPELKAAILGGNIARILGLDLERDRPASRADRELAEPWSGERPA